MTEFRYTALDNKGIPLGHGASAREAIEAGGKRDRVASIEKRLRGYPFTRIELCKVDCAGKRT